MALKAQGWKMVAQGPKFLPSFKEGLLWQFKSKEEAQMYRDKLRALGVNATATMGTFPTEWYIELSADQIRQYFKNNVAGKVGLP